VSNESPESLSAEVKRFGELKKIIGDNKYAFSQFLEARKIFAVVKESPSPADDSGKVQINPGLDNDEKEKKKEQREEKDEHKVRLQKVLDNNKLNLSFTVRSELSLTSLSSGGKPFFSL
jgi:hypothetical protein